MGHRESKCIPICTSIAKSERLFKQKKGLIWGLRAHSHPGQEGTEMRTAGGAHTASAIRKQGATNAG